MNVHAGFCAETGSLMAESKSSTEMQTVETGTSVQTVANGTAVRPEKVQAVKSFLSMRRVRQTPFEKQKAFLISKGVREAEINEARKELFQVGWCPTF